MVKFLNSWKEKLTGSPDESESPGTSLCSNLNCCCSCCPRCTGHCYNFGLFMFVAGLAVLVLSVLAIILRILHTYCREKAANRRWSRAPNHNGNCLRTSSNNRGSSRTKSCCDKLRSQIHYANNRSRSGAGAEVFCINSDDDYGLEEEEDDFPLARLSTSTTFEDLDQIEQNLEVVDSVPDFQIQDSEE